MKVDGDALRSTSAIPCEPFGGCQLTLSFFWLGGLTNWFELQPFRNHDQPEALPVLQDTGHTGCTHLALAVEGRDFVRRCVELCQGEKQWRALGEWRRRQRIATGEWSPEREDYTWLETAVLRRIPQAADLVRGAGVPTGGPTLRPAQAGFWVLLWSKDPRQLWWELRDEFERQATEKRGRSGPQVLSPEAPRPKVNGRARHSSRF